MNSYAAPSSTGFSRFSLLSHLTNTRVEVDRINVGQDGILRDDAIAAGAFAAQNAYLDDIGLKTPATG